MSHEVFDHTSILRMIEARWELQPLASRDAGANSLAQALVGGAADTPDRHDDSVPSYAVPDLTPSVCPAPAIAANRGAAASREHWRGLRQLAREHGWGV